MSGNYISQPQYQTKLKFEAKVYKNVYHLTTQKFPTIGKCRPTSTIALALQVVLRSLGSTDGGHRSVAMRWGVDGAVDPILPTTLAVAVAERVLCGSIQNCSAAYGRSTVSLGLCIHAVAATSTFTDRSRWEHGSFQSAIIGGRCDRVSVGLTLYSYASS